MLAANLHKIEGKLNPWWWNNENNTTSQTWILGSGPVLLNQKLQAQRQGISAAAKTPQVILVPLANQSITYTAAAWASPKSWLQMRRLYYTLLLHATPTEAEPVLALEVPVTLDSVVGEVILKQVLSQWSCIILQPQDDFSKLPMLVSPQIN